MFPYRTRFKKEIVAEFFPPLTKRKLKNERVIIWCPGQPGRPSNPAFLEYWAKQGYWIFAIRYRGSWESEGKFLRKSPEKDVLDVLNELPRGFTELFGHQRMRIKKGAKYYIFGNSFGGPAALIGSRDPRITNVICASPVVSWKDHRKHGETIDWGARFTKEAFGMAYRPAPDAWKKLKSGKFYNPATHTDEINGKKILIIHAKDDKIVRYGPVAKFAKKTGAKLVTLKRDGHGSSSWFTRPRFAKKIRTFLR